MILLRLIWSLVQIRQEFIKPIRSMSLWKLQLMWNQVKCWSALNNDEDIFLANLINCTFIQLRLSLMLWSTGRGIVQLKQNSVSSLMPSLHSSDTDTVNDLRGSSLSLSPSLVESVTVMSVSEAGISTTQRDKGSRWERERWHLKWRATPHVVTYIASRLFVFPYGQQ